MAAFPRLAPGAIISRPLRGLLRLGYHLAPLRGLLRLGLPSGVRHRPDHIIRAVVQKSRLNCTHSMRKNCRAASTRQIAFPNPQTKLRTYGGCMSGVRVLVGTKKGAFILSSDGKRDKW